jgi:hypothetical protein
VKRSTPGNIDSTANSAAQALLCDTPGCGREIPKGGEGHPEICPTCLAQLAHDDKVKLEAVSEYRARLLKVAEKALKHRKKAETDGAARSPGAAG